MADLVGQNPGEDRDASLIAGLPDLLDQVGVTSSPCASMQRGTSASRASIGLSKRIDGRDGAQYYQKLSGSTLADYLIALAALPLRTDGSV
jgi:hypothetical protein